MKLGRTLHQYRLWGRPRTGYAVSNEAGKPPPGKPGWGFFFIRSLPFRWCPSWHFEVMLCRDGILQIRNAVYPKQ